MSAEWCARDTAPHAGLCSLDHGTEQRRAISKTLRVVAVAAVWSGWERAAGAKCWLLEPLMPICPPPRQFKGNEVYMHNSSGGSTRAHHSSISKAH